MVQAGLECTATSAYPATYQLHTQAFQGQGMLCCCESAGDETVLSMNCVTYTEYYGTSRACDHFAVVMWS